MEEGLEAGGAAKLFYCSMSRESTSASVIRDVYKYIRVKIHTARQKAYFLKDRFTIA